jgi:hypothetical protein
VTRLRLAVLGPQLQSDTHSAHSAASQPKSTATKGRSSPFLGGPGVQRGRILRGNILVDMRVAVQEVPQAGRTP